MSTGWGLRSPFIFRFLHTFSSTNIFRTFPSPIKRHIPWSTLARISYHLFLSTDSNIIYHSFAYFSHSRNICPKPHCIHIRCLLSFHLYVNRSCLLCPTIHHSLAVSLIYANLELFSSSFPFATPITFTGLSIIVFHSSQSTHALHSLHSVSSLIHSVGITHTVAHIHLLSFYTLFPTELSYYSTCRTFLPNNYSFYSYLI